MTAGTAPPSSKIEKIFLNLYEITSIAVFLNGVVIDDSNGMEAPLD